MKNVGAVTITRAGAINSPCGSDAEDARFREISAFPASAKVCGGSACSGGEMWRHSTCTDRRDRPDQGMMARQLHYCLRPHYHHHQDRGAIRTLPANQTKIYINFFSRLFLQFFFNNLFLFFLLFRIWFTSLIYFLWLSNIWKQIF